MAPGAVIGFVVLGSSMVPLAICMAFAAVPHSIWDHRMSLKVDLGMVAIIATISFSEAGCLRVEKNGIHLTFVMLEESGIC
eukprot:scaffold8751_cov69-Cylindrotheca_fusiformis.AAC.1